MDMVLECLAASGKGLGEYGRGKGVAIMQVWRGGARMWASPFRMGRGGVAS